MQGQTSSPIPKEKSVIPCQLVPHCEFMLAPCPTWQPPQVFLSVFGICDPCGSLHRQPQGAVGAGVGSSLRFPSPKLQLSRPGQPQSLTPAEEAQDSVQIPSASSLLHWRYHDSSCLQKSRVSRFPELGFCSTSPGPGRKSCSLLVTQMSARDGASEILLSALSLEAHVRCVQGLKAAAS